MVHQNPTNARFIHVKTIEQILYLSLINIKCYALGVSGGSVLKKV